MIIFLSWLFHGPGCEFRVRKAAQSFLAQCFSDPGTSQPKLRDIPAIACLKQQEKAPCIKFLSGTSHGRGQRYPDVWVPDVPGLSCPKPLSLGCFFGPESLPAWEKVDFGAKGEKMAEKWIIRENPRARKVDYSGKSSCP